MGFYVCQVCGFIEFGEPETCPVCWSPKEKFVRNDQVFEESRAKSPEADVKHVPEVKIVKSCGLIPETGCTDALIRIGKVLHPMEEKHFIAFIDCYLDKKYVARIHLSANQVNPAACLHLKASSGKLQVVERCNLHGYWMTEVGI